MEYENSIAQVVFVLKTVLKNFFCFRHFNIKTVRYFYIFGVAKQQPVVIQ